MIATTSKLYIKKKKHLKQKNYQGRCYLLQAYQF